MPAFGLADKEKDKHEGRFPVRKRPCVKADRSRTYAQAATARRAITLTRCARYSALAWMSELSASSLIAMSLIASGLKDFASSASISGTRNTEGLVPVTATRTPACVLATHSPALA